MTIYVYSNTTGHQVASHEADTNRECEQVTMTTGEALEIVWQVAKQNALNAEHAGNELNAEGERQREALNMVEDLIVNEFGED